MHHYYSVLMGNADMKSWSKVRAMDGILVEAFPFLKSVYGLLMILLGVPDQHIRIEIQADRFTICLDYASGVVEEIISVDDADFDI